MRVGIAHHLGWAVVVTASADFRVVGRRRIELVEPGVPTAPIHHEGKPLGDEAVAELVSRVWASASRATSASLDGLATAVDQPIVSLSPAWPGRDRGGDSPTVLIVVTLAVIQCLWITASVTQSVSLRRWPVPVRRRR